MTPDQMNLLGLYLFGVSFFYIVAFAGVAKEDYESPNLTRLAIILWPFVAMFWLIDFIWEVTFELFFPPVPTPPVRGGHIMPKGNKL